jgi:hypothetical protein
MQEDLPKNAAFTNSANIWDAKTGEESAYKTNQGLPVRATFALSCDALDDAKVKSQLYTKESMSCEGTKDVPDDDTDTSSNPGDNDTDTAADTDDSGDTEKENGDSDKSDNADDEDDEGDDDSDNEDGASKQQPSNGQHIEDDDFQDRDARFDNTPRRSPRFDNTPRRSARLGN